MRAACAGTKLRSASRGVVSLCAAWSGDAPEHLSDFFWRISRPARPSGRLPAGARRDAQNEKLRKRKEEEEKLKRAGSPSMGMRRPPSTNSFHMPPQSEEEKTQREFNRNMYKEYKQQMGRPQKQKPAGPAAASQGTGVGRPPPPPGGPPADGVRVEARTARARRGESSDRSFHLTFVRRHKSGLVPIIHLAPETSTGTFGTRPLRAAHLESIPAQARTPFGAKGAAAPEEPPPPPRPTNLRMTSRSDTTVTLEWRAGEGGLGAAASKAYELQWRIKSEPPPPWESASQLILHTTCRKRNLRRAACYEFRVRAASVSGWSPHSEPIQIVTLSDGASETTASASSARPPTVAAGRGRPAAPATRRALPGGSLDELPSVKGAQSRPTAEAAGPWTCVPPAPEAPLFWPPPRNIRVVAAAPPRLVPGGATTPRRHTFCPHCA